MDEKQERRARELFEFTSEHAHFGDRLLQRQDRYDLLLSRLAQDEAWWPTVARLRCFRGVDTLTAFALHLELGGDWQRFARASALSAWLGLTPSLHQSGESSRQDGYIEECRNPTCARCPHALARLPRAWSPGPSNPVMAVTMAKSSGVHGFDFGGGEE